MKKLIIGILILILPLIGCESAPASSPDEVIEPVVEEPVVEPEPESEPEPTDESTRSNPVPMRESLITSEGIEITVVNLIKGDQAWEILEEANIFNESPTDGMQYVIITVNVKNISSEEEPFTVMDMDFELIGSSNKIFQGYDQSVVLPDEGNLSELWVELYHGGEETGSLHYYIPTDETNLVLVWNFTYSVFEDTKQFFGLTK